MTNSTAAPGDALTGGLLDASLEKRTAIATLAAVAWYNAFELMILIFVTFREYHGLYFWSLFVSGSVGLVPYSLGFLLKFFEITTPWLSVTLLTIGWYCMVTGQSVVLYSRLHLVLRNPRVLRRVLTMIIIDAFLLHIPTTVLTYGSNRAPENSHWPYRKGYNIMEKIQMTGFCIQEFIISGLYIWETAKMLRLDPDRSKRKIMYQLVIINLLIILMDLGLLIIEYVGLYAMETMIKGVIYSIKLKLEFAVLGKLVRLVHCHVWKSDSVILHHHDNPYLHRHRPSAPEDYPDFVDANLVNTDLTHAPTIGTTTTATTVPAAAALAARRRSVPGMDSDEISIAMFEHSTSPTHDLHVNLDHPFRFPDHDDKHRDPDNTGFSEVSQSWSGDTHTVTNNSITTTTYPLDFTDSLHKQKCSSSSACRPSDDHDECRRERERERDRDQSRY